MAPIEILIWPWLLPHVDDTQTRKLGVGMFTSEFVRRHAGTLAWYPLTFTLTINIVT